MDTDKHRWKRKIRKCLAGLVKGVLVAALIFIATYIPNSFCGGYWLIAERDGHDRYFFGLSMPTAIMWQPRYGHESLGHWDYLGAVFLPLVRLDRKFVHPTIYLTDDNGFERATHLPVSKIHPHWREQYMVKVTARAERDESQKTIKCILRYTGSEKPRVISEIRMSKDLAKVLEVSPPNGFIERGFGTDEKYAQEHYVRWVGILVLPRDQDVVLQLPSKQPKLGVGKIRFSFQRTDDSSPDFTGICSAELN